MGKANDSQFIGKIVGIRKRCFQFKIKFNYNTKRKL